MIDNFLALDLLGGKTTNIFQIVFQSSTNISLPYKTQYLDGTEINFLI